MAASASLGRTRTSGDKCDSSYVEVFNDGLIMAKALANSVDSHERLCLARSMAFQTIKTYWGAIFFIESDDWHIRPLPSQVSLMVLSESANSLAQSIGAAVQSLDVMEASYLIGALYTGMMPKNDRSEFGAYYTPPALCERLLQMATDAGVDWQTAQVLDPACGGGAFLSPVAQRMAASLLDCSPKIALNNIAQRLRGFEIDPFAAWMSQVFLEISLADLCRAARRRLPEVVVVCDSLYRHVDSERFDLVIGNPPYGRTKLNATLRNVYKRSLFGHANLYGLFTDLALRLTKSGGVIAYVTPTSFLGGEYFKSLRQLLSQEAPPAFIDFVSERKGVFADVLQETLLAVYRRGSKPDIGQVHFISSTSTDKFSATGAGSFSLPKSLNAPWIIPRTFDQSGLVRRAERMSHRFSDYGYKVSTGPLVWNRHRNSLKDVLKKGRYPLVWAEAVKSDGTFEFRATKKNHKPFFEPQPKEHWVLTDTPCVLLQRTTAKEQLRRLIAAELPASFISKYGKVVVENHVNMIRSVGTQPPLASPAVIVALLNSSIVDSLFRCINGSVAVSAYELEALPLPDPKTMAGLEYLIQKRAHQLEIDAYIVNLYGEAVG